MTIGMQLSIACMHPAYSYISYARMHGTVCFYLMHTNMPITAFQRDTVVRPFSHKFYADLDNKLCLVF